MSDHEQSPARDSPSAPNKRKRSAGAATEFSLSSDSDSPASARAQARARARARAPVRAPVPVPAPAPRARVAPSQRSRGEARAPAQWCRRCVSKLQKNLQHQCYEPGGTGVRCWDCAAGNRSCEAVPGSAVPFLASALNDRKPFVERDAAVTKAAQELRKNRAVPAAAPAPVAVAAPAAPAAGPPAAFWDEALELLRRSVAAQERIAESAEDIASAVTKLAKKDDDEDEDEDEESVEL